MSYGATIPVTVIRDPDVAISGTGGSFSGYVDEMFMKNTTTGNYIRVFVTPQPVDSYCELRTEPE